MHALILAPGRQITEFDASLVYRGSSRSARAMGTERDVRTNVNSYHSLPQTVVTAHPPPHSNLQETFTKPRPQSRRPLPLKTVK